jgi:hypothetical protein
MKRFIALCAAVVGIAVVAPAPAAQASTQYSCPLLVLAAPCSPPLAGTIYGDVTAADGGYLFNPSADQTPGYVQVSGSSQIPMSSFPITVSVSVKGVGVPSSAVGDYDVVRGTPGGGWRVEVLAKKRRTIAQAACFFSGTTGKTFAFGGPDLAQQQTVWTTISCTDTGSAIELGLDGGLVKTLAVATGPIRNPGPMLLGAKDTNGDDQFSGNAKNVQVTVGQYPVREPCLSRPTHGENS